MKLKTFAVYLRRWIPELSDPIKYIKAIDLDHARKLARKKFCSSSMLNPIIEKIEEV